MNGMNGVNYYSGQQPQQQQQQQQQQYMMQQYHAAYHTVQQQQQQQQQAHTHQERINNVTMTIENPNVVGSGFIRHPPQKRFQGKIIQQPLTCAADYEQSLGLDGHGYPGQVQGGGNQSYGSYGYQAQQPQQPQQHYQQQPPPPPRQPQPTYSMGGYHQQPQQQMQQQATVQPVQQQQGQFRTVQRYKRGGGAPPQANKTAAPSRHQAGCAPQGPHRTASYQTKTPAPAPVAQPTIKAAPAPAEPSKKLSKSQLKRRRKQMREGKM